MKTDSFLTEASIQSLISLLFPSSFLASDFEASEKVPIVSTFPNHSLEANSEVTKSNAYRDQTGKINTFWGLEQEN